MAKHRIVNTRFWDDSYVARLSPNEKLVFLYLLTSPLTTIAGVYELPVKRASFDISLSAREIAEIFARFEKDGKLIRQDDWIGMVNFIKHQSLNPKVRQGIIAELDRAPRTLVALLPADHRLSIAFDSLSHLNSNSNLNPNLNSNANLGLRSFPQDVDKGVRELVRKMRIKPDG